MGLERNGFHTITLKLMKKGIHFCVKKEEHVRHMCWYIPKHSTLKDVGLKLLYYATLKNIVIALSGQST